MLQRALKAQQNQTQRGGGGGGGGGGDDEDSSVAGDGASVSMALLTVPNVVTQSTLPGTSLMGGGVLDATGGGLFDKPMGGVRYMPGAFGATSSVRDESLPQ